MLVRIRAGRARGLSRRSVVGGSELPDDLFRDVFVNDPEQGDYEIRLSSCLSALAAISRDNQGLLSPRIRDRALDFANEGNDLVFAIRHQLDDDMDSEDDRASWGVVSYDKSGCVDGGDGREDGEATLVPQGFGFRPLRAEAFPRSLKGVHLMLRGLDACMRNLRDGRDRI